MDSYNNTLTDWKNKATQIAFVYDYITDKYKRRVNIITLISFILTSGSTLCAFNNFGLTQDSEFTIIFKIVNSLLTVSATIFTGIDKLMGWSIFIYNCQNTVEHFLADIISEESLPLKYKTDPDQFMLQNKDKFSEILKGAPDIDNNDYLIAIDHFEKSHIRFRQNLIMF